MSEGTARRSRIAELEERLAHERGLREAAEARVDALTAALRRIAEDPRAKRGWTKQVAIDALTDTAALVAEGETLGVTT